MANGLCSLNEHLGYLTSARKLDLYGKIIELVVRPGALVADLGCGSGILGLLCLRAGAAHVWGIDQTDAIEIARETIRCAGLSNRYTCIHQSTFHATPPEPVDLIVSDHVGYFGIDYGIIALLDDARRRLLKPGGRTVPERIDLLLAAVAAPCLRAKADAWAAPEVPAEFHWLREYGVNTKHAHSFAREDIRSDPVILGEVDLTKDSPDYLRLSAILIASHDGMIDGLGGWFDCELGHGVRMTNSPLANERIDRQQVFLPFGDSLEAAQGDAFEVSMNIRHDDGLIAWTVHHPRSGRRVRQSTWNSRLLSEADLRRDPGRPVEMGPIGQARQLVWSYIDGTRTVDEIEQAVLREHPDLFPSREVIVRFVRTELARSSAA